MACLIRRNKYIRFQKQLYEYISGHKVITLPTADSWYRKPFPRLCPGLY